MAPQEDLNLQMYIAMIEYVLYDSFVRYKEKGYMTIEEKIYVCDFTIAVCRSFSKTLKHLIKN